MASERSRSPEYQRAWRRANKARVAEYNRRRRQLRAAYKRRQRELNPGQAAASLQAWFAAHPGRRNAYRAAYNARRKGLTPPLSVSEQQTVDALYEQARALTRLMGEPFHVDHILPLAKGGLHHPANLQVLRGVDNLRKGAKIV